MSPNAAKMAHLPLSEYTVQGLHARAGELREMAQTARLEADIRALTSLARRFDSLADRRRKRAAATQLARPELATPIVSRAAGLSAKRQSIYPSCPRVPEDADFAQAWQLACEHVSKSYVLRESMHHPAVISQCYNLACMLIAYGLVPKPISLPNSGEAAKPATKLPGEFDASRHRAIVVDDVADVLVSVGAFLVHAGIAVRKASNGDEALLLIASDPSIDILVTDFAMPGLNGADLIRQVTQMRPSLKALVITGYPNADGLADLPTGTTVLAKPFRRDALVAAVKLLFQEPGADCEQGIEPPASAHHDQFEVSESGSDHAEQGTAAAATTSRLTNH
jgi:CheY-like chemotaxis protein